MSLLYKQSAKSVYKHVRVYFTDPKPEDFIEPNKLLWNVIPYCNDPVLEESLHELGNIHGFLYARANHMNYR